MDSSRFQVCTKGIWDTTMPGIYFDEEGISSFYLLQKKMTEAFPRGDIGKSRWLKIVEDIKKNRGKSKYDCVVGVSGGVDSSYLLHILKQEYQLNPLAVNLDNGWSSDIAVKNIKKVVTKLDIDLETYVIDYEEMKSILRSYIRASLPWIDGPTDLAIKATMYDIARSEGIKYIFRGNDFRSEGKQPTEWSRTDSYQLKYLQKKYGTFSRLKSFPNLTLTKLIYSGAVLGIKDIRPYYFLEYEKQKARTFLETEYDWEYYGGHHHENLFTKFAMSYWLPEKFGIDKRKINLSAQIVSGTISRTDALLEIGQPHLSRDESDYLVSYVLKKLDISAEEFNRIMDSPNKYYYDYPSNMKYLLKLSKYFMPLVKMIYPIKPMSFFEMEQRKKN